MKKKIFAIVLVAFGVFFVCARDYEEYVFKIMTWEEKLAYDHCYNSLRGQNIKNLTDKFKGHCTVEKSVMDEKWMTRYGKLYGINEYGDVKIPIGTEIRFLCIDHTDDTFLLLSPKMHDAARKFYVDEVYAAEKDGEWIVFASRRVIASFEPPN